LRRFLQNLFGQNSPEQIPPASGEPFPLDTPLLQFTNARADLWTLRDACEGVQIFGALGSGKTTGSGQAIARAFLASGFGGLVLTAKPDERELWEQYAKETGRSDHIKIFKPGGEHRFNFLDYEMRRPGEGAGDTENLVRLFRYVLDFAQQQATGRQEPYWDNALNQLLRNAIDVTAAATGGVGLREIREIIKSAPLFPEQVESPEWCENSFCMYAIEQARERELSPEKRRDLEAAADYWTKEFPNLSEKTRSIIVSMFTGLADIFLRGQMHDLFCTGTNLFPEHSELGYILILDLPVKQYGESGRLAQVLFKYLWQKAIERRNVQQSPRPVFIWADEAQNFCASYDMQFQATARSSKACTVYLTQNLPNYYAAFGGGDKGKHETDALLGNLATKIFHANGDHITNNYAADTIGKDWQRKEQINIGQSQQQGQQNQQQNQSGASSSEVYDYIVPPIEFTRLRKGGAPNGLIVDGFIFQSGRRWTTTGRSQMRVSFRQI
jgi:type IV secretory pathway TraG/TraD family ATPase VirD4